MYVRENLNYTVPSIGYRSTFAITEIRWKTLQVSRIFFFRVEILFHTFTVEEHSTP